jgi:hypothetical protein
MRLGWLPLYCARRHKSFYDIPMRPESLDSQGAGVDQFNPGMKLRRGGRVRRPVPGRHVRSTACRSHGLRPARHHYGTNGTAEIMTDGVDGLILPDPNDVAGLAERIRWLYEHPEDGIPNRRASRSDRRQLHVGPQWRGDARDLQRGAATPREGE